MTARPAPKHLQGSVAALWELRGDVRGQYAGLPKPYAEFVISLSGWHVWRSAENASPLTYLDGWLTPVQAAPRFAQTFGRLHLIGARLHPASAARLAGPADASGPAFPIPLDALLGTAGRQLRQWLLDAKNKESRFQVLASWLQTQLGCDGPAWLPDVHDLGRLGWRVDGLAEQLGLSTRGLHKRFVQQLGIGPKLWLQLGRFDAALRCRPASRPLADLAVDLGYSDQAHMTAEFRRFAGVSPGTYIRSRMRAAAPDDAPHLVPARA